MKIYKASAGSGKTYTLALEYIKELFLKKSENSHRKILAVTFTKDATGEMKDRILAELYGLAFQCEDSETFRNSLREELKKSGKYISDTEIVIKAGKILKDILHDFNRLHITTIDSFFQKVLRNLARELGTSSRFNLEMNNMKVLSEGVRSMIENASENPQVLDWLTTYIEERLDEGNNWRIDREIINFSRCIFDEYFQEHEEVLRKQLETNPKVFENIWKQHILLQKECKSFFRKAYKDISRIIEENNFSPEDFSRKGTVINFFKKLAEEDFGTVNPGGATIRDCCNDPEKWAASKCKRKAEINHLATINFIPLLNHTLDLLKKFYTSGMITKNIHQLGLIWDITREIQQQNIENNKFMLADTALFLNKMIDDSDASFIYEKIGAEIDHVMIDEFQDTSRLQWKNFRSLLTNIAANNYFSLIVGDVKQSIYRWRNGDWNILNNIENEIQAEIASLGCNYRSEAELVNFNNWFFTHTSSVLDTAYTSLFGTEVESPFKKAYAPQEVEQTTLKSGIRGHVCIDFIAERQEDSGYEEQVLEQLVHNLSELYKQNIPAGKICILTRTNRNIIKIGEYLSIQKTKYPELADAGYLDIISNEAFLLNSSPVIKIIIEGIRILSDSNNPVHKAHLEFYLEKWNDFNKDEIKKIWDEECEDNLSAGLLTLPLFELTGHLFRLFQLEKIPGQSNYLFTFYDSLNAFLRDNPADIYSFLKYWEEELQFKSIPSGTSMEGIRAMTIHKSKGLQFHTVLLPYCDWDIYPEKNPVIWCGSKAGIYDLELLPVKYNHKMKDTVFLPEYRTETGQTWMDNLNVLYVAFTRAEENLLIIAKNKKKLEKIGDIKNVSDLLKYSLKSLNCEIDLENNRYEKGILLPYSNQVKKDTSNLLKQVPEGLHVKFNSFPYQDGKSIFKQSNQSREFISDDFAEKKRNEYLHRGNIMHKLFSYIHTYEQIETAVEKLVLEGLIPASEKKEYLRFVKNAIRTSGCKEWFNGKFRKYNECNLLTRENNTVIIQRPDKVLINEEKAIVIDFKFGEVKNSYRKQITGYTTLMKKMGYKEVEGYIWYVYENKIEKVPV